MDFDVFISYSSKDAAAANAACAALEAVNVRCWIAPRDIQPSADWAASIMDAIARCRVMVLVFSSHANQSKQVHREVKQAFDREKTVVPFRIENADPVGALAYYMGPVHWLDALTPPFERHLNQLSLTMKRLLADRGPMVEQKAGREGLARENEERGLKELEARDADEGEERLRHKTASVTGAAMRSLADLSEVVGFFSYSRDDDEDSEGALLGLRDHIQRELRRQMGRSESDLRLWQEKMPIPGHGKLWENEIERAIAQSFFFIPIMTPRAVKSEHCRFQLRSFLAREAKLGRDDLIFPILYLRTPALEDEEVWRRDVALKTIVARQYTDLQNFRHYDLKQPVPRKIEFYCEHIVHALHESRMISR